MSAAKDPAAKWAKYQATMAAKRAAKQVDHEARFRTDRLRRDWFNMWYGGRWARA